MPVPDTISGLEESDDDSEGEAFASKCRAAQISSREANECLFEERAR
jgi:hypothetical protein